MLISTNLKAFLSTLAWSEGTDNKLQKTNDRGYDVLVGGGLFYSYKDHPRKLIKLSSTLSSTAAGRYQILARTYDAYKEKLNLKDFSPTSQDAIAIQLIKERKALDDIEADRFEQAVIKCNNIWASLPNSPYGQHTHSMMDLKNIFLTKKIQYT